jgi:DNA-binding response OmpR family regulator
VTLTVRQGIEELDEMTLTVRQRIEDQESGLARAAAIETVRGLGYRFVSSA